MALKGDKVFGDKVKAARKFQGLTSVELAKVAGITENAVYMIEGGHMWPCVAIRRALVETLNLPADLIDLSPNTILKDLKAKMGSDHDYIAALKDLSTSSITGKKLKALIATAK